MKLVIRPIQDQQRELDVTHRLVSAIAEELWRLYGGNEQLNWVEAELHLQQIVGEARAEARDMEVDIVAPFVAEDTAELSDEWRGQSDLDERLVPSQTTRHSPLGGVWGGEVLPFRSAPDRRGRGTAALMRRWRVDNGFAAAGRRGRGEYVMTSGTTRTVLLISGMRGNGCRDQITRVLESVAGVKNVDVNLYRALATILHDQPCDAAELIRSVLEAGYGASLTGEGSVSSDCWNTRLPGSPLRHRTLRSPLMSTIKTTQKARDVMAAEPLLVEASATIRQLARILSASTISEAPVVNREGTLIGFVSKTDLLRACSGAPADCPPAYLFEVAFEQDGKEDDESHAMAKPLGDGARVVNHIPLTVTPDTSITHIASLMLNGRIHRIIVLEPAKLPAILVTTFDLSEVVSH